MKESFQEVLLYIPLYQLTFLTPLPKELVYYETTTDCMEDEWLEKPTLLIIHHEDKCEMLNDPKTANQLIQDSNLIGIVICMERDQLLQENICALFQECQIPIIQITDCSLLPIFEQRQAQFYSYGQLGKELVGTMENGFIKLASELAKGLGTPLLYLDENHNLLWQYGKEVELREANRWLNIHRSELEKNTYTNSNTLEGDLSIQKPTAIDSFELYAINIAGVVNQTMVASANLADWQKRLVDKLVGLTALLIQTERMFHEQQEIQKEHFIYELLYHKFESHRVMVKHGKSFGWNLEKPHHILVVHVEASEEVMMNLDWLDEIMISLEAQKSNLKEMLIIFPFRDQIVVLIEDEADRTISERKNYVNNIATQLKRELSTNWSSCQFFIGIGKWYQDTTNLNKSYQEAKLALQFGQIWFENKKVYHINDLGVLRLLIQIHREVLNDFSNDYLSLLNESDEDHGTEYLKTLKAYIQHKGVINDVSDVLYIHPNTLRNRIKKIEDMTGIDLQDPEEFMNLIIAVNILSLIKK